MTRGARLPRRQDEGLGRRPLDAVFAAAAGREIQYSGKTADGLSDLYGFLDFEYQGLGIVLRAPDGTIVVRERPYTGDYASLGRAYDVVHVP